MWISKFRSWFSRAKKRVWKTQSSPKWVFLHTLSPHLVKIGHLSHYLYTCPTLTLGQSLEKFRKFFCAITRIFWISNCIWNLRFRKKFQELLRVMAQNRKNRFWKYFPWFAILYFWFAIFFLNTSGKSSHMLHRPIIAYILGIENWYFPGNSL